ncbi:lipoprotein [Streptomyces sp. OfavH-34-F]|uniref:lipoprotein n=1 Tax=Streptomyces sp. OfavH-34-F TaxID=2917760 RepID=UPI001EF2914A|nr:lipoprotein [Streptomyces sp. OfavH-34-F]MCG7526660.1 lipoprotein [Streptomyces sp. OfavH-34-F]
MTLRTVRGLVPVLLAAAALTGCSSEPESGDGAKAGKSAAPAVKAAAKGGTVGGAGSGCELPVTFDLAKDWKPKAVEIDPDSEFAELAKQGPVTMACEIDAKPAGQIGFLRVWQAKGSDASAREVLKGYVEADKQPSKITYKQVTVGGLSVTEASFTSYSELFEENSPGHAFAVATPKGPVVIGLNGMDPTEIADMLPAYELAKKSVRVG